MQPGTHARLRPDHPAVIMGSDGRRVSYSELEVASIRLSHLLRSRGLTVGDHIAVLLDNTPEYFEVVWAAQRSGLYVTPVNWHLHSDEAGYIISDCGASALVTTSRLADTAKALLPQLEQVTTRLVIDGELPGFEEYGAATADQPVEPLEDETEGALMLYSSGTTGWPKGIMRPLSGQPFGTRAALEQLLVDMFGFDESSVYLCPAPLYHTAPLGWSLAVQAIGATVVVMERFDAVEVLRLIEEHRVTHAQFVPTHFIRLLKLPEETRRSADLSSLQMVVHAAAPCPVEVKHQMMQWFGPIVHEYYGGSEGNGLCAIGPGEWLEHPGSVGRSLIAPVHILDDQGNELGPDQTGQIWFESPARFEYHHDPAKTAAAWNERGWSTLGDVGRLDAEGYLYLTDRVSHMIISGGVNVYPQEIENLLVLHPAVADVAVIGVPDPEMGEAVKAVVVPTDPAAGGPALAEELIEFCRERMAHFKCPRSVDFVEELPRLPTGKLLKRVLIEEHRAWANERTP